MAKMTLDDLVGQLHSLYGADLRAVVLYGSAAFGEYHAGWSDHNVLVLVESLDLERMRLESAIARGWREAGNPPPLTMTVREWEGCADVFPMEVSDILALHRVLHGTPPFDGVRVKPEHFRLQLEEQALGKLLQLRQGVLAAGPDDARLLELLGASLSTFMVIFRAVARLHGETAPAEYEDLCGRVARWAGFDIEPFDRVVAHVKGRVRLTPKAAPQVLAGYLAGLQRLVAHVDAFRDGRGEGT